MNPHRSILGLGNFDINVIMNALLSKGCEAEWFDKRKDPGGIAVDDDNLLGFILNVPADYKFGFITLPLHHRRHWISLRKAGDGEEKAYYSFDSKQKEPVKVGQVRGINSCSRPYLCVTKRFVRVPCRKRS